MVLPLLPFYPLTSCFIRETLHPLSVQSVRGYKLAGATPVTSDKWRCLAREKGNCILAQSNTTLHSDRQQSLMRRAGEGSRLSPGLCNTSPSAPPLTNG